MKKNPADLHIQVNTQEQPSLTSKVSSFAATRLLKQTQDNVDTIHRRIKMLKIIEQKNTHKIEQEKRRMRELSEIKQKALEDRMDQQRRRQRNMQSQESQYVKAQSHKRRQEEKLSQIREELREIRNQESNQTRLESQNIEGKIKEIRKDYQKENQMRRDMVVSFEEKQKRNVDRHIKERILSIHGGITETVEEMLARKRKRERELKRLEEVEMGLMEKCSQTNSQSKLIHQKLQNMKYTKSGFMKNKGDQTPPTPSSPPTSLPQIKSKEQFVTVEKK